MVWAVADPCKSIGCSCILAALLACWKSNPARLLALFKGAFSSLLRPRHPQPLGRYTVGALRARLPLKEGGDGVGLLAQIHYPATPNGERFSIPTFDYIRPEVLDAIAEGYNLPRSLLHLSLGGVTQVDPPLRPKRCEEAGGWPVIIFSSGLWGCCEMYTQLCRELASLGAVVVAPEHEDGTGVVAFDRITGRAIDYVEQPTGKYNSVKFNEPFLQTRLQEMVMTIEGLRSGSLTQRDTPEGRALAEVLASSNPGRLVLVGHSFGSAALLHCLCQSASRTWGALGSILLDLWTIPLSTDTSGANLKDFGARLNTPVFLLHSELWERTQKYKLGSRHLACAAAGGCLAAGTVWGASHQWVSDTHLFAPAWILRFMGLMGKGQYRQVHVATMKALREALEVILGQASSSDLKRKLSSIDSEVLSWSEEASSKL